MKRIALFKARMDFISIVWSYSIVMAGMAAFSYLYLLDYPNEVLVVVTTFFISAMAFKITFMGIAHTLVIMSQDLNVLVKDAKIREVERSRHQG